MIFNAISMGGGGNVLEGTIEKPSGNRFVDIPLPFAPKFVFAMRYAFDSTTGSALAYYARDADTGTEIGMYGSWSSASHSRSRQTGDTWNGTSLHLNIGVSTAVTVSFIAVG